MRTITHLAVKKFLNGENFSKDNTRVFSQNGLVQMILHGNPIAIRIYNRSIIIDNCGWFSNTTKERLNGLLYALGRIGIQQKDFKWYLDGKEWNGKETRLLPNNQWEYVFP